MQQCISMVKAENMLKNMWRLDLLLKSDLMRKNFSIQNIKKYIKTKIQFNWIFNLNKKLVKQAKNKIYRKFVYNNQLN